MNRRPRRNHSSAFKAKVARAPEPPPATVPDADGPGDDVLGEGGSLAR